MRNRSWIQYAIATAALATSFIAAPFAQATPPAGVPAGQRPAVITSAGSRTVTLPSQAAAAPKPEKPAPGTVNTSSCTPPALSRPFASVHDAHWYTLMGGETADNFGGAGWTLSGGARIVSARLADGRTGSVLELPTGAAAISPTICVTSAYPAARMVLRELTGSGGVAFSVAMAGTRTWSAPQSSGQRHGRLGAWKLSSRINLHPTKAAGWHLMRIKLLARGHKSEFQLYNLYIDPRIVG